jgi:hypothetical protein
MFKIKDREVELTYDEAKALWKDLDLIFGVRVPNMPVYPPTVMPTYPPYTGDPVKPFVTWCM